MRKRSWGRGLAGLLLALGGCSGDDAVSVAQWTLQPAGAGPGLPVTLPAHLPDLAADGGRPGAYRLSTEVALPASMRGQALTLVIDKLPALAVLRAAGEVAAPLDRDHRNQYRVAGPQRWRVPAAASDTGRLRLELELTNTWAQSGWLDTVPKVSATTDGDRRSLALYEWNRTTAVLGLSATLVSALIHLALFLLNRTRRDDGWYAAEALGGALYPALGLNLLQPFFGTAETSLAAVGVSAAGLAGVHMAHAYLGLGRPHRAWDAAWLAHVALAVGLADPFLSTRWVASTAGLYLAAAASYQVIVYFRASRRSGPPGSLLLSAGWLAMATLGGVDIASWMGFGALFGGWQGAGIGIFMIALAQSVNLSRAHIRALAKADTLNRELRARIAELEASNRKVLGLHSELRHQVGVRSQELADALGRAAEGTRALRSGEVVNDRYRIEELVGSGGMGVVYRATRLSDDLPCAIKVIKHRPSPEHLARLAREALVLSQIDHPNIIGVHDISVSDSGQLFLVMELAAGKPLDAHAERYGDVAWALPLLRQTADALTAIHARGVVHRDLKPSNILLVEGDDGSELVKVVDFGVAGLIESDAASLLNLVTTVDALEPTQPHKGMALTETGALLGTPLFMAPELVAGTKEVGPPADVFSFGVVSYQVLSRELPFSELPLVSALHGRPIVPRRPLSEACPGLPGDVAGTLMLCLRPNPDERPRAPGLVDALTLAERALRARTA